MKSNDQILSERVNLYNQIEGPRVGDYLKLPYGLYVRFSHDWSDHLQTSSGGSYYLGNGYISMSGSLDSGVKKSDIVLTEEVKSGSIWFFDEDLSGANRGVCFDMDFRVFALTENADVSGLPQIKAYEKKQIQDLAEKVTRFNGNGHEYTLPLPEVLINADYMNDVYIAHFEKQTGCKLQKQFGGYLCQPMRHEQLTNILLMGGWESTYYNNAMWHNTLMLKFKRA